MTDNTGDQFLQMMEDVAAGAAAITGMKKQYLDLGWSEESAEQVVILLLKTALVREDSTTP